MRNCFARFAAHSTHGRQRGARRLPLRLERLEDRVTPAVITVTTTIDTIVPDGLASLREAITSINNQADVNSDVMLNRVGGYASAPGGTPDVINFDIFAAGVRTISATAAEPTIVQPLTINGYSQAGASANTLANADNAVILIQLDGTGAGAGVDGLTLGAGSGGSTIKGLDVTNFTGNGIVVDSNGNSIFGNFIGVDPTGTTRRPNGSFPNGGDGIRLQSSSNNLIGSPNPADRNIASGNAVDGIHVEGTLTTPATGNLIQGNFVGVAADGKSSVGNRTERRPGPGRAEGNNLFGIEISGGNNNTVGGTLAGARNVVGLNGAGIEVDNGGQSNVIQGNFSGVGADGVTPAGNLLHGIVLRSSNGFSAPLGPPQPNEPGVSFNLVGGTAAGAGNLVEFNGTAGIAVFGNPVSASGQSNVGNTIEGNSFFQNGRNNPTFLLGIDLTNQFLFPKDDGLTPNDSKGHGAPNSPNNFQNFPVLTSAVPDNGKTDITGTFKAPPNSMFRIEFFASNTDPAGGIPEGQQFLGSASVTTDASGNAPFNVALSVTVANGRVVTAIATDAVGNTSEFSAGLTVPTTAATMTALTASPNPVTAGQSVTFTATVTPAAGPGVPAGMVQFLDGAAVLQTVALSGGSAAFSTSFPTAGGHMIVAVYQGGGAFAGSSSPAVSLTVSPTSGGPTTGGPGPAPSASTVGVFDPATATWYLRSSNSAGRPDAGQFQFGPTGSIPVSGDWDGGGPDPIGVFDPNTASWFLRNETSAGAPDAGEFRYGGTGFVPVTGDWNNSGHTGIGAFDSATATWYLRNEASGGAPDAGTFQYGLAGSVPVVGDWTGTGHLGIGVFDPATFTWYLRSTVSGGAPDVGVFQYGGIGAKAVAGDWTGAGHAGIGVFDPGTGTWLLRTEPNAGAPGAGQFAFGGPGLLPVVGAFPPVAQHLLAAGGEGPGGAAPLSIDELRSAVAGALARLSADGAASLLRRLASAEYDVAALPPDVLGLAEVGANRVTISADAAGYGWTADGGRMDLSTAVRHEMGHLAGLPDVDAATHPGDPMADTLAPAARGTQALDQVFAQAAGALS